MLENRIEWRIREGDNEENIIEDIYGKTIRYKKEQSVGRGEYRRKLNDNRVARFRRTSAHAHYAALYLHCATKHLPSGDYLLPSTIAASLLIINAHICYRL